MQELLTRWTPGVWQEWKQLEAHIAEADDEIERNLRYGEVTIVMPAKLHLAQTTRAEGKSTEEVLAALR